MINKIKRNIPIKIKVYIRNKFNFIFEFKFKRDIKKIRDSQVDIVKDLQKKKIINVIFLVIHDAIWKYKEVYKLLNNDTRFNVKVVIIPLVRNGLGDINVYNETLNYFVNNNYNVIPSYDNINNSWLDIKALTKPDIVFFTNPHKLTFDKYYIDNFQDKLTCYVPYSFQVSNLYESQFNQPIHSMLWKQFYETEFHKAIGVKYSRIKGQNVIVTGYPGVDEFNKENNILDDPWPIKSENVKRIIWAPHHTIPGFGAELNYSSFVTYADSILEYLKTNKSKIQIAFKPHPLLKERLYQYKEWGKERTDRYYASWTNIENGIFHNSDYVQLFIHSNGMIHDSGSFTAEYLMLNKPVMFIVEERDVLNNFNEFGKECLNRHYLGYSMEDIRFFIENIIKLGEDKLFNNRKQFVQDYCLPPNNTSASKNIYNYLLKELR